MTGAQRIVPARYRIPPFELHWGSAIGRPLPVREVPGHGRSIEAPPWIDTGTHDEPFNFSTHLRRLCAIASKYEPLRHLDVSRMIFSFTPSKNQRVHGLQAKVTPLRFANGERIRMHRGVPFQVQQFFNDQREILYIVTFCLPRFLNRGFEDKFVTIFHELFHIGPEFDGDLRRHEGRYAVHTASQKRYDQEMAAMAREYLQSGADPKLHGFLRLNHAQLRQRHGKIVGHAVPRPKLIPIRSAFH